MSNSLLDRIMAHSNGTMAAAEQLTLFADSILRNGALATAGTYTSKRSNSELVASLRSLFIGILPDPELEASPDEPPSHKWDPKTRSLYIPAPESLERTSLESAREDLDVTAKFFYLAPEPSSCSLHALPPLPASWARDALDRLNEATGLAEVDTFILSFPGIIYPEDATNGANGCGGCDDENARSAGGVDGIVDERELTRAAFEAYVDVASEKRIRSLGIADFALEPLQHFLKTLGSEHRRPRVDQVNLRDCCSVSRQLIDYASGEGIELLTHADCSDLLPPKTFHQLLSDARASLPAPLQSADLTVRWVLKYTVVHKQRNVVVDKGYVVFASSRL